MQIPPMPPFPPTDPGQGPHGSQPWYSRLDDIKFLDTVIAASAGARVAGLNNAANHLDHYLNNSGETLALDPDRIMNDEPNLKLHFDAIITGLIRAVAANLADHGRPVQFQSRNWEHYTFNDRDWYLAIGSVEASACGVVTLAAADQANSEPRISVVFQCHLFDRYNWDGTKTTEIGGFTWSDRQLGALHTAGLAKEFDMVGSSAVRHYEGVLPSFGALSLPAGSGHSR